MLCIRNLTSHESQGEKDKGSLVTRKALSEGCKLRKPSPRLPAYTGRSGMLGFTQTRTASKPRERLKMVKYSNLEMQALAVGSYQNGTL